MLKLSKDFKDYAELYQYLRDLEKAKLLEGHPESGQPQWRFLALSLERATELYNTLKRALIEGSGVIAMLQDDGLHLVVASPGVDIEGFRKDFCDDYCHAHKLVITECD